jgi:hypothetical protein
MLRFVVPTSVGIANQVCNEMPAEASTTDGTVKLKPLRFNPALVIQHAFQPRTKHLQFSQTL